MKNKKLIFVPFAYVEGANTGANIRCRDKSLDIYLKNCCVALVSARNNNPDSTDCALVTNLEIPAPYRKILVKHNVLIIKQEFDLFDFGHDYKWSLAFYKLCALYNLCRLTEYEYYAYLDSDIIFQYGFDNVWEKCKNHILTYDVYSGRKYPSQFFSEVAALYPDLESVKHLGGEFYASNRENAIAFTTKCLELYRRMLDRKIRTNYGDEFILSIAACSFPKAIYDARGIICRCWTGTYRLIPDNYRTANVLHIPAEKEHGVIKIYDRFISKDKPFPGLDEIYRVCHLEKPSLYSRLKRIIKLLGCINVK